MSGRMKTIAEPTLRRLPIYLNLLKDWREQGRTTISCTVLADHLRQDPTQIRKDLSAVGVVGKPRVGFDIDALVIGLTAFLGWNNTSDAFLVGAGSLGTALLGHADFRENGLNIVAAFDIDPAKTGGTIHGKPVFDLDKLTSLTRRMRILIGVITTPSDVAQDVANRLIAGGIRGIWNFTPVRLQVPVTVVAENAALTTSLGVLSNRLSGMMLTPATAGLPAVPERIERA